MEEEIKRLAMQTAKVSENPNETCHEDDYGNPLDGDRLIYCCFPDCGCDGARLCVAEKGASERAHRQNVEGMYHRTDKIAIRARMSLAGDILREKP